MGAGALRKISNRKGGAQGGTDANLNKGGLHQYATLAERNAIPAALRRHTMRVSVLEGTTQIDGNGKLLPIDYILTGRTVGGGTGNITEVRQTTVYSRTYTDTINPGYEHYSVNTELPDFASPSYYIPASAVDPGLTGYLPVDAWDGTKASYTNKTPNQPQVLDTYKQSVIDGYAPDDPNQVLKPIGNRKERLDSLGTKDLHYSYVGNIPTTLDLLGTGDQSDVWSKVVSETGTVPENVLTTEDVDSELSATSVNPPQTKAVHAALGDKAAIADVKYEVSQVLTPFRSDIQFIPTYDLTKGGQCPATADIKSKVLTVSGVSGALTLTVNAGLEADFTGAFPCVIYNGSSYESYYCKSVAGGIVTLSSPLKTDVVSGSLKTMHDGFNGQHLTDYGYRALADYIFNFKKGYAKRNAAHILQPELNPGVIPFTPIGGATSGGYVPGTSDLPNLYQIATSSVTAALLAPYHYVVQQGGTARGVQWSVSLGGKTGYFETAIGLLAKPYNTGAGTTAGAAVVTVDINGVQVLNKTISNYNFERITVPFSKADTAVVKIVTLDDTPTSIAINRTGFYITPVDDTLLFKPTDKVVFLGDSWTQYATPSFNVWNQDLTERFKVLFTAAGGNAANIINSGRSGMTSAWARYWFQQQVLDHNPTIAVLEYFVNDSNSSEYAADPLNTDWNFSSAGTHTAGKDVEGKVTHQQWLDNMLWMAEQCFANGIQPIILMPAHTASVAQTQNILGNLLSKMGAGKYYDVKDVLSKNAYIEEDVFTKRVTATESLTGITGFFKKLLGGTNSVGGGFILETEEANSGSAKGFKVRPKQRYTGNLGRFFVIQNLKSGKTYETATEADFDDIFSVFNDGMVQTKGLRGEVYQPRIIADNVSLTQLSTHHFVAFRNLTAPRQYNLTAPTGWGVTTGYSKTILVKDESGLAGTHNITITAPEGFTIDGAASKVINTNFGYVELYTDGANIFTK